MTLLFGWNCLSTRPREKPTLKAWSEHTEHFNFPCLSFWFQVFDFFIVIIHFSKSFLTSFPFYNMLVFFNVYNIFSYFYEDVIYAFLDHFSYFMLSFVSSEFHCSLYWFRCPMFMLEAFCNSLIVFGSLLIYRREVVTSSGSVLRNTSHSFSAPLCFSPSDSKFKLF